MRVLLLLCPAALLAQQIVTVRPQEIDDVLVNPGIGFTAFHRTDAQRINPDNKNHPAVSIDYLRLYWILFEPERGKYRWDLLDNALKDARAKGRTLMFRIMPYGSDATNEVPPWYRAMVGPEPERVKPGDKIRTNPEDPRYVQYFGGMVREIGRRYDGHPDLDSVDISIVGAWGEGAGSAGLTQATREALVDAYLESFQKTPLMMLLTDERTNRYGISKAPVGYRFDCLGDMGGFGNGQWSHMLDYYPQGIVNFGMRDAWRRAPASFEACWVMPHWKQKGWDIEYIIEQSLKWHISSFNGKSAEVPEEWWPAVNRWLKRMGYRLVLRKFTYPAAAPPGGKVAFTSWWENKGVAPPYREFPVALRLKDARAEHLLVTQADVRKWLPGDNLHDDAIFVPAGAATGEYDLDIALLDPLTRQPKVKLAIAGVKPDGWYPLGKIRVEAEIERAPRANELGHYPADGQTVAVNPPGFFWTPNENAKSYRIEIDGAPAAAVSSTVYPPYQRLAEGRHTWRVVYLDARGEAAGVSKTRRFTIAAGAPEVVLPRVTALKAWGRPPAAASPRLLEAADAALQEPLYSEPPARLPGEDSSKAWLRTFTPGKQGSAHAARLALAFRVTGERKYLEGARKWLLHLAFWDPKGIASHGLKLAGGGGIGNDEASMPMLERMSLAWNWIGSELTAAERARVLAAMTERGNQVLRKLEADDFLSHPFNNHSGRALAFLGQAGLAFFNDIQDAPKWLDYVLRAYLTSYPPWGGDEGGWSQGISYWSFYVYCHTNFAIALREATGIDLFALPFFRNTGYFAIYFQPPYAPGGAFGDGGYHRPSEAGGLLTDLLADMLRDPILKWQAREVALHGEKNATRWREWFTEDVYDALREARAAKVEAASPARLDGSRHFPDIGWVAIHSALGDAANDVWALFKSSPIGTASHSHADNNTFQLHAYGRALAIDSGYYPAYGTPHDNLWTRQTRAHNGILVNGRGQPPHTWEATGAIERYERRGEITIVRGQAAGAYNLPQPASLAKLLQAPTEPAVRHFARTLAFHASKNRPFLVVHDALRAAAPTTFEWLLHAANEMKVSEGGAIEVHNQPARMAVRLIASVPFRISQRTGFPIKPEFAANTAYVLGEDSFKDQWHLSAGTTGPASEVHFLAILAPYRDGEPQPQIERTAGGLRLAGHEYTLSEGIE